MPSSDNRGRRIHRRDLNKGAATAGLVLTAGALGIPKTFGQSSFSNDLIQAENAKPGRNNYAVFIMIPARLRGLHRLGWCCRLCCCLLGRAGLAGALKLH